ncbi:MAG: DNA pilot protein [Microviridae sp.]|nr:MAG: DNA pilot protein [Microviridae sp.]
MLGALIGAAGSLAGGLLGASSAKKAANLEYQRQKEFAKKAIQWKAADAEAAGISKLYALGANTTSYAPVSTGGSSNLASGISDASQYLGRALDSGATQQGRSNSLATAAAQVQLEGLKLDNENKKQELLSKIALNNQAGTPPPINSNTTTPFIPGQGNASTVEVTKKLAPSGNEPNAEFGVSPDIAWVKTKNGWAPTIPQQLAESYESDWIGYLQWAARNQIAPIIDPSYGTNPPQGINPGQYWQYYGGSGDYRPDWAWKTQDSYRR